MALSDTAKRRLTKLIEFMETLPASANKHFNMRYVVGHNQKDGPGTEHKFDPMTISKKDLHTCGTTACALGWAATMPYFKRAGLRVILMNGGTAVDEPEVFDLDSVTNSDGKDPWIELFGGHNNDKTPKAWAKRAKKLLREWSKQD